MTAERHFWLRRLHSLSGIVPIGGFLAFHLYENYDRACLEEVCGSCAMRINGVSRMASAALIDALEQPIRLEPLAVHPTGAPRGAAGRRGR